MQVAAARLVRSQCIVHGRRCFASATAKVVSEDVEKQRKQDYAYCVNLVQQRDREAYLCGLLFPDKEQQQSYFAIRAFNVEIATIKDMIQQRQQGGRAGTEASMALQMRVQWWRDAIETIYTDDNDNIKSSAKNTNSEILASVLQSYAQNPVVRALRSANQGQETPWTARFLERLIDAREMDWEVNQPDDMDYMINYAQDTASSLLYLNLESFNVRDQAADEFAWYAGVGMGLVTALRSTPYRLLQGEVAVPKDLLRADFPYDKLNNYWEESGANDNSSSVDKQGKAELLDESDAQMWRDAVRAVADTAAVHLNKAQDLQKHVPKHAKACLLPVVPSIVYLSKLEKANYHLWSPTALQETRLRLLLTIGRTYLTSVL